MTTECYFLLVYINEVLDEIRRLERNKKNMPKEKLELLSLDDFEETHNMQFRKRYQHTGQWLLDDPRFINWRDGTQSSLLWCHGARKSYLYS